MGFQTYTPIADRPNGGSIQVRTGRAIVDNTTSGDGSGGPAQSLQITTQDAQGMVGSQNLTAGMPVAIRTVNVANGSPMVVTFNGKQYTGLVQSNVGGVTIPVIDIINYSLQSGVDAMTITAKAGTAIRSVTFPLDSILPIPPVVNDVSTNLQSPQVSGFLNSIVGSGNAFSILVDGVLDATSQQSRVTTDEVANTWSWTPASDLANGTYEIRIEHTDTDSGFLTATGTLIVDSTLPPEVQGDRIVVTANSVSSIAIYDNTPPVSENLTVVGGEIVFPETQVIQQGYLLATLQSETIKKQYARVVFTPRGGQWMFIFPVTMRDNGIVYLSFSNSAATGYSTNVLREFVVPGSAYVNGQESTIVLPLEQEAIKAFPDDQVIAVQAVQYRSQGGAEIRSVTLTDNGPPVPEANSGMHLTFAPIENQEVSPTQVEQGYALKGTTRADVTVQIERISPSRAIVANTRSDAGGRWLLYLTPGYLNNLPPGSDYVYEARVPAIAEVIPVRQAFRHAGYTLTISGLYNGTKSV